MLDIIPIFKDHSSNGILVPWKHKECTEAGAKSIIDICKESNSDKCYLISDNFHSFIEAWENTEEEKLQLIFGLEVLMCNDSLDKSDNAKKSNHKIILWMESEDSYQKMIKLSTAWKTNKDNELDGTYRFDYKQLKQYFDEKSMKFMIPYFDSFIQKNLLIYNAGVIPDISFIKNIWVQSEIDSGVPYSRLLDIEIDNFIKNNNNCQKLQTKTCNYYNKKDFLAWQINQCIHNHSDFSNPRKEFMCSDNFSFEDYKNLIK